MFCYQCQETSNGNGCTKVGVCGKDRKLAIELDVLIFETIELAALNHRLREYKQDDIMASRMITDALFVSITNANFDVDSVKNKIKMIREKKSQLKDLAHRQSISLSDLHLCLLPPLPEHIGILNEPNEDVRSLKQLIIYGLKGAAAYMKHAQRLGFEDNMLYSSLEETLSVIRRKDIEIEKLLEWVLGVGELGIKAMSLLDKANTSSFGMPEYSEVSTNVGNRPGILVSGHDLQDLKELLEQSANCEIDIYTHGEMLPAHYYPFFKKYSHFKGNYGNAWWQQKEEFEKFNGPILFTSNCIVPPPHNKSYKDRIYTTGSCYLKDAKHIPLCQRTNSKDFSSIIAHAQRCKVPEVIDNMKLVGGFAHNQLSLLKPKIVEAIKKGRIRKFVVMAGCDGRMALRSYYRDFAKALPSDCIILTAGCAKYRYNKAYLESNADFPRVLDAGQCNDSYSLIVFADELRKEFNLKSINDLPIVFNIAWYEQKAVVVLLALLALGIRNIHLGPTLPAFLSPNVLNILKDKFNLETISSVKYDIRKLIE